MRKPPRLIPAEDLELLLKEDDSLRVAVRGHQGVETLINFLFCEVLPHPDFAEFERMRFGLKVDLLVAMGYIRAEDRPAFDKLDQLRNRLAHRPDAEIAEQDARDFVNAFGTVQRKMLGEFGRDPLGPRQTVAAVALILHSQLWMAVRHFRDDRISIEYQSTRLRNAINHVPHKTGADADQELEGLLRQSHQEREGRGEP